MSLKLFNTLSKSKEIFHPIDTNEVKVYACGPTLYNNPHIGNFRPIIVFDVLFRILRNIYGEGFDFVLIIVLICICSDIGGFLFGKIFKGPKLTKVSPNKTYSGVLGAYFLSIVTLLLLDNQNIVFNLKILDVLNIYSFVILVSTVSQIGDIFISYLKRLSNVKDTGKIIPGHGGLLDRIDGMIFALPFSYLLFILNFLK